MKHDFNSYFYINHVSLTFIDDNHDQGTQLVLKGIDKQSDIGLLSLFEHYKSIKVGNNLKNPKFPIWVICSESHFTVLFRYWFWFHAYLITILISEIKYLFWVKTFLYSFSITLESWHFSASFNTTKGAIDLLYYDQLGNQLEPIFLTVHDSEQDQRRGICKSC